MSFAADRPLRAEIELHNAWIIEQVAAATFVSVLAKVKHVAPVR
jgi:hypothetical protein